ncbi:hypothetical protein GCM10025882_34750 [Acinetobacter gyllenbergii]|uniref:Uncharacterized protein n=1 Tax=Acinetobacter gyllenbergii CIP 110306 = MTCC 11365 TaxID=1217657 RepID=A0A829HFS4_9GAMM|nr:hypothetical protein [Acinetobacter gyllenbergii]EPF80067.1 hypothetical protein F957_02449 [Acinetobacter gyllenbergii CIP 110306 = MTCC 11365]ESK53405.1 hypothetical protein F987_01116 [Acinetobacter gyllenbergii NIPH 230]GMA13050.1 hypothetical protein GCM10025882_34750 [Acinetobacter gyllenbergii]
MFKIHHVEDHIIDIAQSLNDKNIVIFATYNSRLQNTICKIEEAELDLENIICQERQVANDWVEFIYLESVSFQELENEFLKFCAINFNSGI